MGMVRHATQLTLDINADTIRDLAQNQHQLASKLDCEGSDCFSTSINLQSALDLTASTGIWGRDLTAAHPSSEMTETGVVPIHHEERFNCRFELDNIKSLWRRASGSFDLIQGRGLLGNIRDWVTACLDYVLQYIERALLRKWKWDYVPGNRAKEHLKWVRRDLEKEAVGVYTECVKIWGHKPNLSQPIPDDVPTIKPWQPKPNHCSRFPLPTPNFGDSHSAGSHRMGNSIGRFEVFPT
ncbi:hypothetical protein VDGE_30768 [Verticillium dahliae]|uniref:Uncharacterized protein n=1 Tax=Verticillium dahliae TaxID=27337 RepID=A0A444RJ15_VERDA|nr:hypothetical protein VDGE_30768 [Verticillium dahliae]